MGKASLTIQIGGEYNNKAVAKAKNDLRNFQLETARSCEGAASAWVSLGDKIVSAGEKVNKAGGVLESAGDKLTGTLTVGVIAAGTAAIAAASDYEQASSRIQAALGKTEDEAAGFSLVGRDIYENGWGESLDEVTSALLQVKQTIRDIDDEGLETVTQNALVLSDVFDADVSESIRGTNALMEGFGLSAEEASDLLAAGMQRGLNYTDELGDNLSEYSVRWGEAGMEASQYFSFLEAGTSNGAYNLDKVGDFLNEFLTSLSDGRMDEGIENFDQGTRDVFNSFKEGKATAEDVLSAVIGDMKGMTDETKRAAAASSLWSSLGEDNAMGMILSLGDVKDSYTDVAGAADQAAEAASDNFAAKAESAMRKLKGAIEPLGEPLLRIASDLADSAAEAADWFSQLDEGKQNTVLAFAGIAAAAGPVLSVSGKLMKVTGGVVTKLGKGAQNIGIFTSSVKRCHSEMVMANNGVSTMKTKLGALNQATGLTTKGMNLLNGACKATAVGLALGLVADLASQLASYAEHERTVEEATTGMTSALDAASAAYDASIPSVDAATGAMEDCAVSAEDCLKSQAELAKSMNETWTDYGTNAAMVDTYAATIQELGNKGSLSAAEQERLRDAVQNLNEITGESISVVNSQTGELSKQKDAILEVAEAYKEEAKVEAARELYKETTKQLIQDQLALKEATEELQSAEEGWGLWIGDFPVIANEASVKYHELQGKVDDLTAAEGSASQTLEQLMGVMVSSQGSFETLDAALGSCGVSMSDFGSASEAQLSALKENFDGSLNSIVQTCVAQGLQIPASLASGITANSGLPEDAQGVMFDALVLKMAGGDVTKAAEVLGHDIDEGLKAGIEGSAEMPEAAMGILSEDVISKAKESFESHSPSQVMHRLGNDIDTGLANGIDETATQPTNSMLMLSNGVQQQISGLPLYAQQTGNSSGYGLASTLGSYAPTVSASAGSLATSAQSSLSLMPVNASNTGSSAGSGLAAALGGFAGAVGSAAYGLLSSMSGGIASMPGVASNAGSSAGSNIARGLNGQAGAVQSSARNLSSSAERGVSVSRVSFARSGQDAARAFTEAIARFSATSHGQRLGNSAVTGLRSTVQSARGLGADFATGYGNGISSKSSWVYTQAYNLAKQAVNAVKAAQNSNSPSKVTFGLGGDFGTGYGNGMEDRYGYVAAKASGLTESAVGSLNDASDFRSIEIPWYEGGLAAYPVQETKNMTVNIYIDGQRVESGVSQRMDTALGQVISEAERYINMGGSYGY